MWVFLIPGGPPGYIGNIFAKAEFKCLLVATIVGLKFKKDGKREAVIKGAHGETPGGIPVSVREVVWGRISRLFREYYLSKGEERMGGWKVQAMPRIMFGHSTISALSMTSSKTVRQPNYRYSQLGYRIAGVTG